MNLRLAGKVVLIVGASAGIGAATARLLTEEGARIALVARRSMELEALAAQLRGAGGAVLAVSGDASVPGFLDGVVADTVEHFGALHGLAVVAGPMGPRGPFVGLSDEEWEFYFRQSTMVAVRACRAAIPELVKHAECSVVLTSAYSIRAQKPDLSAYSAMKTTIAALSKNLAKSYGKQGLRVNCIAPGVIEKSALETARLAKRYGVPLERARYEYVHREFGMNVALERAGRYEEFADLLVYLLSARASYISGTTINIDGGTDF